MPFLSPFLNKSTNSQRSIFVEKRAYSIGDLITIDVLQVHLLPHLKTQCAIVVPNRECSKSIPFANSKMGTHNGGLPGTEIEMKTSNQGGGSIANTQDLKGRVSVVVIDVLPNGNLVIEGARMVTFSEKAITRY